MNRRTLIFPITLAGLLSWSRRRRPTRSDTSHGSTLACKAVGQACVNPGDCCSHHCKNFSAGFYCYKTEQGLE